MFSHVETWREVAAIMGASERAAADYMKGEHPPPLKVCQNIKDKMGVSLDEFLSREYKTGEAEKASQVTEREKHYRAALDVAIMQTEKTLELLRGLKAKGRDHD